MYEKVIAHTRKVAWSQRSMSTCIKRGSAHCVNLEEWKFLDSKLTGHYLNMIEHQMERASSFVYQVVKCEYVGDSIQSVDLQLWCPHENAEADADAADIEAENDGEGDENENAEWMEILKALSSAMTIAMQVAAKEKIPMLTLQHHHQQQQKRTTIGNHFCGNGYAPLKFRSSASIVSN
jgi:hypothetical protein